MGQLCAVSFNRYGRLFYLNPGEHRPKVGDLVLVPTEEGPEVAECVWAPEWTDEDTEGFPRLIGMAGPDDLRRDEQVRRAKADAKVAAKRLIRAHELPMKVVAVDHILGGHSHSNGSGNGSGNGGAASGASGGAKTTIYFTAPHRVAISAPHCVAGWSCASSPLATRPGSRAASDPADGTSAVRPSSPISSRSLFGWPRTRICR